MGISPSVDVFTPLLVLVWMHLFLLFRTKKEV